MRRFTRNGEIVDAIRYQPGHAGHIIHCLSEIGIPCLHTPPGTGAISIFDGSEDITIQDPRHDFGGNEGMIYPGDWIVWRKLLEVEIVPSRVFESQYAPLV